MKIIYFTKYNRNGASSRLRSYQFFPLLENKNISVTVKPFFNETYLNNLYSGQSNSKILILGFYLKRFFSLFFIYKYDKIVIEKELFPYFFSWFEKIFYILKIKYIVDYDDAIFHNYDLSKSELIQFLLKNKIVNVMKYSDYALAGNNYLAEKAKASGARKIVLQPTVIDISKYKFIAKKTNSKIVIGWIGSPTTFKYIIHLKSVFENLITKFDVEIQIIGANEDLGLGTSVRYIPWSEDGEADSISNFDIGIMPLENTPWELGKCSYKLIQYMGCAIPVVASAVGMNNEVVDDNVNGFLVENETEWVEKLSILIENETLRKQFGENGRKKVENCYSLENNFKTLLSLLYE